MRPLKFRTAGALPNQMIKGNAAEFAPGFWCLGVCGSSGGAGAPQKTRGVAPRTNVRVDGSEAMFTTMCALYAAGYEGEVNEDNWSTFRTRIRERCADNRDRQWKQCASFTKSINCGTPGRCSRGTCGSAGCRSRAEIRAGAAARRITPDMLSLEGFSDILSNYYTEQKIGRCGNRSSRSTTGKSSGCTTRCRRSAGGGGVPARNAGPKQAGTFTIVVEPLVGRITNVRNYGDNYAIILSGSEEIPADVVRHAFLHFYWTRCR